MCDYWDLETGEGLSDAELHERYDDMLDEIVNTGELNYPASTILKTVDPVAYRCGYSDWLDDEFGETITDHIVEEELS